MATLFVADLFNIPLKDDSIDLVYSSHSLEPNGGREDDAVRECLRVAKDYVVLIEPIYEFASPEGQKRMEENGYIKGLKRIVENHGAEVVEYRPLPVFANPLNPSGLIVIKKNPSNKRVQKDSGESFRCPVTNSRLVKSQSAWVAEDTGIVYPVLEEIPLLRPEHSIVASAFRVKC